MAACCERPGSCCGRLITVYNADWRPRRHASGTATGNAGRIGRRSKGSRRCQERSSTAAWRQPDRHRRAAVAGNAHAGKPMNVLQKKAAADAMARDTGRSAGCQGHIAAGRPLAPRRATAALSVPDGLRNYHAQVDANGKVRILETDGPTNFRQGRQGTMNKSPRLALATAGIGRARRLSQAQAADIIPVITDPAGVGYNDTTPAIAGRR